jgi:hypothetical protein
MRFKSDLVSQLLRIVTPAIIAELSTDSSGKKKVSLSDIVHLYCDKGRYDESEAAGTLEEDTSLAKILPFNIEKEERDFTYQCGQRTCVLLENFLELCKKMEKNLLGPSRITKRKITQKCSSGTDYLIDQKKQFENSYALLKSQEVLSLYKAGEKNTLSKNSSTEQDKDEQEEFHSDQERGILINKKQA